MYDQGAEIKISPIFVAYCFRIGRMRAYRSTLVAPYAYLSNLVGIHDGDVGYGMGSWAVFIGVNVIGRRKLSGRGRWMMMMMMWRRWSGDGWCVVIAAAVAINAWYRDRIQQIGDTIGRIHQTFWHGGQWRVTTMMMMVCTSDWSIVIIRSVWRWLGSACLFLWNAVVRYLNFGCIDKCEYFPGVCRHISNTTLIRHPRVSFLVVISINVLRM